MAIKIIECPRDAMQGMHEFIPTETKINYLNALLKVGFDTLDFGSFVSPKAIPQLKDTAEVLAGLNLTSTHTKLLAIVANLRGAEDAMQHAAIKYIGFPFSISETFQQRNTNSSIAQSMDTVKQMQALCMANNKTLVVYISMGFGNPYGDDWNADIALHWVTEMDKIGVRILSLSDTIGIATPESIRYLFSSLIPAFKHIEFGAHLHTTPDTWREKVDAAYQSGCKRFDGAIKGFGGCPMAADTLTGNMPTEKVIAYFTENNIDLGLDKTAFNDAMAMAGSVFSGH
ncbi:MAG: hydroxymethylglutaryl-CoA lyase [Bacteroidia bacterium]|nr:hydroxymethylglutaryl-CoA lyase [Bacteroidia bacterium]MBP9690096.1 hydroxymethylglutaryl-CoA lyase [Bacteroidia bacterium]